MARLWFKQEKLLFAPDVLAASHPLAKAPDIHELTIDVPGRPAVGPALAPARTEGRGVFSAWQWRQPGELVYQPRVLSPGELRPVHD